MTSPNNLPRRLVLLRHAKADPGPPHLDQARPLAIKGRRQAMRISAALAEHALHPELVLCSSALRTRQTWDLIRSGLGNIEPEVIVTDQLYESGVAAVLAQIREVGDGVRTVLVIGHEPTMSRTAVRLASETSDKAALAQARLGMSTGTFMVLELDRLWKELEPHSASVRAVVLTTEDTF